MAEPLPIKDSEAIKADITTFPFLCDWMKDAVRGVDDTSPAVAVGFTELLRAYASARFEETVEASAIPNLIYPEEAAHDDP